MTYIQALILAGGADDALARHCQVSAKGLCSLAGKPMVQYPLDAMLACPQISQITLVGPTLNNQHPKLTQTQAGASFVESLKAGYKRLHSEPGYVLICSGDIPFLSQKALEETLSALPTTDLIYTVVTKQSCQTQYPNFKRTYVKLKNDIYTGGNLVIVRYNVFEGLLAVAERAYQLRKQPLRLASVIGFATLWQLLWRQLTLTKLEQRIGKILGMSVHALVSPHASLATDIDKPEQLQRAEALLAKNHL